MALNSKAILNAMVTHVKTLGGVKSVKTHEPKSAPVFGSVSIWLRELLVDPSRSGLNRTNVSLVWTVRVYGNMLAEPQDEIDLELLDIMDRIVTSFNADFTLGNQCKGIDIMGMAGTALGAKAGYFEQDKKMYRVIDVTVPVLVNNVWTQGS